MSDNIHVAVRMRPLIQREIESKAEIHWKAQQSTKIYQPNSPNVVFQFDRVFRGRENNEVVYAEFCSPIVKSVIDGFNGTIFAYGQTSSGKTFTMMGDDDGETLGVIHHTVSDLFTFIQNMPERVFLLRVSYMEIYNEMVRDLLADKNEKNENMKLKEDQYGVINVDGLSEQCVQEADQVLKLMRQAEKKRRTGETRMNEKSSRSHSIFRMIIESGLKGEPDAAFNVSQFNLVDLAGSERARHTGAKGARFKESVNINKSLLMLSQVISQLSEKVVNDQYINYRDSKLTRILQNSLGGNARTAIICTVTPACLDETLSTLKFAERAKRIKNKPKLNEVLTEQGLLKKSEKELKRLTKELEATKEEKAQQYKSYKSLQEQIENLKKQYVLQINPEIKNKSNRRETWGGCLDASRLKAEAFSHKRLASFGMETEHESLKPRRSCAPPKKLMPPLDDLLASSSRLSILEEESESTSEEEDSEFSQSSKFSSKLSFDVPLQTDINVRADSVSSNELTHQLEQIHQMSKHILELKAEYAELKDVTTLERQLFRAKSRTSFDSTNRFSLDVTELSKSELSSAYETSIEAVDTRLSQLVSVGVDARQENSNPCVSTTDTLSLENLVCSDHSVFESESIDNGEEFGKKLNLTNVEIQTSLQEFNEDKEEFFDYLENTIKMLGNRKKLDLFSAKCGLNSQYKITLDMFNLVLQYQCLTFKGSFKTDLAKKIDEISSYLNQIFESFSNNFIPEDTIEDMIENFKDKTDGILKEIEMFSLDADDFKPGFLNHSIYNESFLQRHSFEDSVLNISNAKSPHFSPLRTIAEVSLNSPSEKLSTSVIAQATTTLQFTNENALRKCISTLEKEVEIYRKSVSDLQYESELKDKQISILKDKVEIQEKIIDGFKDEVTFKSENDNHSNIGALVLSMDSSSQTLEELSCKNMDANSVTCVNCSRTIEGISKMLNSDASAVVEEIQICKATYENNYSQTNDMTFVDGYSQTLDEPYAGLHNNVIDSCSQTDDLSNIVPISFPNTIKDSSALTIVDAYSETLEQSSGFVEGSNLALAESSIQAEVSSNVLLSNAIVFTNSSCQTTDELLHVLLNTKTVCTDVSSQTANLSDISPHYEKASINQFPLTLNSSFDILPNCNTDVTSIKLEGSDTNLKGHTNNGQYATKDGNGDFSSKDIQESPEENLQVFEKYDGKLEEIQSQVEADLQVTLNDLLELRVFALEFMKREMEKFLFDVEFLENNASSPILDQIKIEVTALKELLVRIEFYIKNQNEHNEHFNEVLEKNMLENCELKEKLEYMEFSIKEKDTEQMNMNKLLLDVDSSISELLQNITAHEGMKKSSSFLEWEGKQYPNLDKNKPITYIKLIQKKIFSLGSIINKSTSLVADLSTKLQETEVKLKSTQEMNQRPFKLTKNVQTVEDNRLVEMSKKLEEAEVCLDDLKKEINSLTHKLEIMNSEKDILEDKLRESYRSIETMRGAFEVEKIDWKENTMECVKRVEEKCDQMMIEQENKYFEDIDMLRQQHNEQMLRRTENYKVEQEQWQCKMEELRKKYEANMADINGKLSQEIEDRYNDKFKLEDEIGALKEKIRHITQLNSEMKDKYKKYFAQMQQKLKEKANKFVQEKETQTEFFQSNRSEGPKENIHTKTPRDNVKHIAGKMKSEHCSNCKDLLHKLSRLQTSKGNENPNIVKETEVHKKLKKELSDLRYDMISLKRNYDNLLKEKLSVEGELSSKLGLLKTCYCRLNPKPVASEIEDPDKLKASTGKKRIYEDSQEEASDLRKAISTTDSADILKNEIIQRAIQEEANSLKMAALHSGTGPDGTMKCAFLNQELKKKTKELEKKNKELETLQKKLANTAYSKQHNVETLENQPVNAVEDKKKFHPFHPYPQGAVPKVQQKNLLKETNRQHPTSKNDFAVNDPLQKITKAGPVKNSALEADPSIDLLKMNRNDENKVIDPDYEQRQRISKLTGDVPECRQQ